MVEVLGIAVLLISVLCISNSKNHIEGIQPLLIRLLIWVIGMSLGGPTGLAANPARDLGPRIIHAILPISGKGNSD